MVSLVKSATENYIVYSLLLLVICWSSKKPVFGILDVHVSDFGLVYRANGRKKYLWVPDSFLVSINGRDSFETRVICSRISHSNLL